MEEIRNRMLEIADPRHPSYVKYALADILIIIMSGVLCGLDTLKDLVGYAKSAKMNGKSAKRWRKTRDGLRNEFAAKSRTFPG